MSIAQDLAFEIVYGNEYFEGDDFQAALEITGKSYEELDKMDKDEAESLVAENLEKGSFDTFRKYAKEYLNQDIMQYRGSACTYELHGIKGGYFHPELHYISMDIGDGEFGDPKGDDWFLHVEYDFDKDEWVAQAYFEDEVVTLFPNSPMKESDREDYLTEEEFHDIQKFVMEELQCEKIMDAEERDI